MGNEQVDFLIDTGATYSVLNTRKGALSQNTVNVTGATGKSENLPFFQPLKFKIGKMWLTHQFLYMPECPMPLLGRDILSRLDAKIIFKNGQIQVCIPKSKAPEAQVFMLLQQADTTEEIPEEVNKAVNPSVWATDIPGRSKAAEPARMQLKPDAKPVRQKQYPLKLEARQGLEKLLAKFLQHGQLRECESVYNTPILPVKKPHTNEYRLVQDLRAMNKIVQDVHPVVSKPLHTFNQNQRV